MVARLCSFARCTAGASVRRALLSSGIKAYREMWAMSKERVGWDAIVSNARFEAVTVYFAHNSGLLQSRSTYWFVHRSGTNVPLAIVERYVDTLGDTTSTHTPTIFLQTAHLASNVFKLHKNADHELARESGSGWRLPCRQMSFIVEIDAAKTG